MTLGTQARDVRTRLELAAFIGRLVRDWQTSRETWQNTDIEMYLDALSRWLSRMEDRAANLSEAVPAEPSWSLIAQLLFAGKVYE
jgi:hypothetical protein